MTGDWTDDEAAVVAASGRTPTQRRVETSGHVRSDRPTPKVGDVRLYRDFGDPAPVEVLVLNVDRRRFTQREIENSDGWPPPWTEPGQWCWRYDAVVVEPAS